MGGQVGDSGTVFIADQTIPIINVLKDGSGRFLQLKSKPGQSDLSGEKVILNVHTERRQPFRDIIQQPMSYTGLYEMFSENTLDRQDPC